MRVAAIDIGTNSVHLLVAEVSPDGQIAVIERARQQVELGAGGFSRRVITPDAWMRGVEALAQYRAACDSLQVEDVHVGATSAVREASNGDAFCQAVKERTGLHVRVISGADEARLVYLGARSDLDFSGGRVLLFDLGGGSTEFVLCDAEQPLVMESLPLGHIRLQDAFLKKDPLADDERKALRDHCQTVLAPLMKRLSGSPFGTLVGTSGTARALARIAALRRGSPPPEHEHGLVLHREELEDLIRAFRTRPQATWSQIPGLDDKRRRTIAAGAVLVREILKATGKEQMLTSERSLRDGLIVDWVLRHRPELAIARTVADPRRRSVLAMLARYGGDEAHGRATASWSLQLFDATVANHHLGPDDRRLLEFAALLHDVGHHIDGEEHHRHGQYLIRNTRMPGFTAPEVNLLGLLVRYHRGSRPKPRHPEFASLSPRDQQRVRVLSGILRVGDALDRGHQGNVARLDVSWTEQGLALAVWTRDEGHLERWAVLQRVDALADALGVGVTATVSPISSVESG